MKLFKNHLLLLAIKLRILLQGLLKLGLLMEQLFPLRRDMRQVLYYGVLAVQEHYQHGHGFDVLLGEVRMLELYEIVLIVDLEASFLAAKAIQESLLSSRVTIL
jgi:hypothetical protein